MSQRQTEDRLISWAMCLEVPPHDPSRPSESIEYRLMTLGDISGSGRKTDGGHMRAYQRHRRDIEAMQQAREVQSAVSRMRHRDRLAHDVIVEAFTRRPGFIVPAAQGAAKFSVGLTTWRKRYDRGLAFVDGALAVAA